MYFTLICLLLVLVKIGVFSLVAGPACTSSRMPAGLPHLISAVDLSKVQKPQVSRWGYSESHDSWTMARWGQGQALWLRRPRKTMSAVTLDHLLASSQTILSLLVMFWPGRPFCSSNPLACCCHRALGISVLDGLFFVPVFACELLLFTLTWARKHRPQEAFPDHSSRTGLSPLSLFFYWSYLYNSSVLEMFSFACLLG